MKAFARQFAGLFSFAKSERANLQTRWDIERARAAKYGPSHVSEIDAIFARQQ